jgi:hypothetical protein
MPESLPNILIFEEIALLLNSITADSEVNIRE